MRKIFKAKKIFILGGHAFSVSYHDKLITARSKGDVSFESIFLVDPRPDCLAGRQNRTRNLLIQKFPADFIVNLLRNKASADLDHDILVPDHTAPHVLFRVFLDLLRKEKPEYEVKPVLFDEDLKLPFQKNDPSGVSALSFATWICPADCDEPNICPKIENTRTWNFRETFEEYKKVHQKDEGVSLHFFYCDQLAKGIVFIRLPTIGQEWEALVKKLDRKRQGPLKILVATYSKCHGILGSAIIYKATLERNN